LQSILFAIQLQNFVSSYIFDFFSQNFGVKALKRFCTFKEENLDPKNGLYLQLAN
jgi:hypothetical protein